MFEFIRKYFSLFGLLFFSFIIYTSEVKNDFLLAIDVFLFSLYLIRRLFSNIFLKFPLAEIFSTIFFIENCLSLYLLYLNQEPLGIDRQSSFYCFVDEYDFLIFSLLSSQTILLGFYLNVNKFNYVWKKFVLGDFKAFKTHTLIRILIIALIGSSLYLINFSLINQVIYFFNILIYCSLFALILQRERVNILFLIGSLLIVVFTTVIYGMTGTFIYFLLYFTLLMLLRVKKVNFFTYARFFIFFIFAILCMGILQKAKTSYRDKIWFGNINASANVLLNTYIDEAQNFEVLNFISYAPLLFRLNQGFLVSSTMVKVPQEVDFEYGSTILNALTNAFVPRIIDPTKEEAGGRQKIKKFTNIELIGSTSMNIGYLGEAYVNFGTSGAIVFMTFLGFFLGRIEVIMLRYGDKNPFILFLFPIIFFSLIGSGSDFLSLFNSLLKGAIFITGFIYVVKINRVISF